MKSLNLLLISALLTLAACSTGPVTYQDPGTAQSLTLDFDLPDVNAVADTMVDSMLTSPSTVDITKSERPILVVDRIQNRTDQHIDTVSVTDSIRTRLIRSGKFRFVDASTRDAQRAELLYQETGGMTNPDAAIKMGQQLGAEYMVTGAIVSYSTSSSKRRREAYKLTLNMINLKTGIIEWADEKPILKEETKK
tara:strand:- start:7 stop:588 length:582 start_codon:yes stop_codon:yes gene_type:complete